MALDYENDYGIFRMYDLCRSAAWTQEPGGQWEQCTCGTFQSSWLWYSGRCRFFCYQTWYKLDPEDPVYIAMAENQGCEHSGGRIPKE